MSFVIFCDYCPIMSEKFATAGDVATEIARAGWELRVVGKDTLHRCPACKRDNR